MEYIAITHDGKSYRFGKAALDTVTEAMTKKLTVVLEGVPVSGSAIARVEKSGSGRYGPENTSQLSLEAGEVFAVQSGKADYWKARIRETLAPLEGSMEAKKRAYLEAAHNPEVARAHREAAMERLRVGAGIDFAGH